MRLIRAVIQHIRYINSIYQSLKTLDTDIESVTLRINRLLTDEELYNNTINGGK